MMKDVLLRVPGAALYILLLLGGLYLHQPYWGLVCLLFFGVALFEWRRLLSIPLSTTNIIISIAAIYTFIHVNFFSNPETLGPIWINGSFIATILFYLFCGLLHQSKLQKQSFILGSFLYLWTAYTFLFQMGQPIQPLYLILLFSIIWSGDTFAYIGGKLYGKNKLAPKISPGKTWEGAITGVLFSGIVAWVVADYILRIPTPNIWFSVGILVSIFGILGDLFESKLKRKNKIKDSGRFFPGHGGILDRMDSIIFALPIYYICITILKL